MASRARWREWTMTNGIASETNGITLLPCPYCGGEAELVEADYGMFNTGYAVYCRSCCTKVGVTGRLGEVYEWTPIYATESDAIAAWNTRADTEWGAVPATEEVMAAHGWVRERTCEMEYGGDVTEGTAKAMGVYFCSECGSPNYNDSVPCYCIYCGKAVKR